MWDWFQVSMPVRRTAEAPAGVLQGVAEEVRTPVHPQADGNAAQTLVGLTATAEPKAAGMEPNGGVTDRAHPGTTGEYASTNRVSQGRDPALEALGADVDVELLAVGSHKSLRASGSHRR